MSYLVNEQGYYGEFGGAYVPEILYATMWAALRPCIWHAA